MGIFEPEFIFFCRGAIYGSRQWWRKVLPSIGEFAEALLHQQPGSAGSHEWLPYSRSGAKFTFGGIA